MNALRKPATGQQRRSDGQAPILVVGDALPAASPARLLQQRLEEAALRSFYAAAPVRRRTPLTAARLRVAGAISAGLIVWGGLFEVITARLG